MGYSCIIPVYNEELRVGDVLKQVVKSKKISEIICVDDGSSDNSSKLIKKDFPTVKIIKHQINKGKTASILTGLITAKNENLLLIDSDLVNLKSEELYSAIKLYEERNLDCLILRTCPINLGVKISRKLFPITAIMAGDRIIKISILEEVLKDHKLKSYQLEIALNRYLLEKNKKIAYITLSAKDINKVSKVGFIKGSIGEMKMWFQIISYAGFFFLLNQTRQLNKKQL